MKKIKSKFPCVFILMAIALLFLLSAGAGHGQDGRNDLYFSGPERPWINSNLLGRVRGIRQPSLREDFYVHVNYDWLADAKLIPGRPRNDTFFELQDIVNRKTQDLMTDASPGGHDADLVRNLYALWLDWDARNAEDENSVREIRKHTDAVKAIQTLDGLTEYFKSSECLYHGAGIVDFGMETDLKDSSVWCLELGATALSLGDSAEYATLTPDGERTKKMNDAIAAVMLGKLGYSDDETERIIKDAFAFEARIAKFMLTYSERRSPDIVDRVYNPVTMQELREKSKAFPLADILAAQGAGESRLINLEEPAWLDGLNGLYTEDSLEGIKAYLIRDIASSYIGLVDEKTYREYQRISNERDGISESRPDRELAVVFVRGHLPTPLSKLYAARYVTQETRQEVTGIIRDTIGYYRTMLGTETWLSEATRAKAVEKLDAITARVAWPDKWRDYGGLTIGTKADGETLLSAMDRLNRFRWRINFFERINRKVDRELWSVEDITQVNAFYDPTRNAIMIVAGILDGGFYRPDMSREEKLAAIGMVIGHEISHAFDTLGAQFDRDGSVRQWWTDEDYRTFQARADRLIRYFNGMIVTDGGGTCNGSLVQTESIADMAGIKAMLGLASEAEKSGNFDYDKFFRAFANMWKAVRTRELTERFLKVDPHALPYLRVNAVLQQFEKFHGTYGVTSGDRMWLAPEDRVSVW